jgi:ketosteroid isomerase-like protein
MELEAIAKVFANDCVVEFGPDKRLNSYGSQAVAKSLERMWRWARTSHHLSNVQICFDGEDRASSVSYVLAWHERPDKTTATIYGQYHDQLRREHDGWRITKRVMYMNGSDAGFTVNIHPFKRKAAPKHWMPPDID